MGTDFVSHIPSAMKSLRVVEAYHDLLMDVDPTIRIPAAAAWYKWESAHVATTAISRPSWLIHGRLDLSGPLDASWNLHQAWPGIKLIIVDDEGHGGPKMAEHWIRILNDLANNK